ncbi:hypothetical protein J1N35_040091 [Gossypium stocksii]|uniref:Uncharacterized protein n=1 Tax=Gossypium stocksii TaxID=47602 RepID=A0A9D3UDJ0_9ROSI|nr:hypothetical protein J1N35_040091 [Gossypium stocksii]
MRLSRKSMRLPENWRNLIGTNIRGLSGSTTGTKNIKHFHATKVNHIRINSIQRLKNVNGLWEEEEKVSNLFLRFFSMIFPTQSLARELKNIESVITSYMNASLQRILSQDEIKNVVSNLGALKALELDGFARLFYHQVWGTIKKEVVDLVQNFFSCGEITERINETNLTKPLISKLLMIHPFCLQSFP